MDKVNYPVSMASTMCACASSKHTSIVNEARKFKVKWDEEYVWYRVVNANLCSGIALDLTPLD